MASRRQRAPVLVIAAVAWLRASAVAQASEPTPGAGETEHLLSLSVRGGAMATDDQRQILRLDQEGAGAELRGGLRPWPWLAGELGVGALVVGGRGGPGALLDVSLGLRAMPRFGRFTPYAQVAVGVGVTGGYVVPILRGAIGLWLDIGGEWSLGPEVGVTHAVWEDGPTRTSDALFVSAGASLVFRPTLGPEVSPEARTTTVVQTRTRVIREAAPTLPLPPPTDPTELLRLVDRAIPPSTSRTITSLVPPLLFEHDDTALSSCGEASLHDVLVAVAEAPPESRVVIEGHADGTGDDDYNRALSLRRAEAVREVLVGRGVAPERIEVRAAGEGEPLVAEVDARTLSLNRRVVVHLVRTASAIATEVTP